MPKMERVLFCILFVALGKGFWNLGWQIVYEWYHPYNGDEVIFVTMGRAIVNGLIPYVDLFENKPPGIFLLAAISLRLFDTLILGRVLHTIAIFIIPLVTVVWTPVSLSLSLSQWKIDRLIVLLFGIIIATSNLIGSFYPELFSILFSLFYVTWFITARTEGWAAPLLGGIFIAGAIGFKEVSLFLLIAIALVLSETRREFVRKFCVPFGIAVVVGVLILLILGYLIPYITVYLPYLFRWHGKLMVLLNPKAIPLWQRGFPLQSFWQHAVSISIAFPLFLAFIWSALLMASFSLWKTQKVIFAPCVLLGATYSAILAGQIAGGKGHHFAVAMPFFLVILLRLMRSGVWNRVRWMQWVVVVLLDVIILTQNRAITEGTQHLLIGQHVAEQVDSVLDSCGVDRYLRLTVPKVSELLFVHHSPLSTGLITTRDYLNAAIPPFNRMLSQSLLSAKIALITDNHDLHPDVYNYVQKHFTTTAWPCSAAFDLPKGWSLLFRKA